ncbi:hypothetical protein [Nitrosomonas oligotropha]|uniref:hypothetical protein n=1 Tax=Nitrosomonas oligotropha TaxID=42354 RepID=UPI0013711108|nr:hypothetical protein [Nitrosomonas oligotropha]
MGLGEGCGGCDGMVIKDGCGGFWITGLAAITGITIRMSPCPRHSGVGQNPFTVELMSRTAV